MDASAPEIPGYRTLGLLGEGGQGTVVLAERLVDGRKVAVKVLRAPSDATRRRFVREIALSRSFAHPNVVKVVDGSLADDVTGDPWLAMEYLSGESLAERLSEGPMAEAEVVPVARQVAAGLSYVHARGLVHRDVKPANVVVEDDGRAVLLDFGLATGDELTRLTRTREIPGTFVAMAPEQLDGRPTTAATDVYQLGVTLYAAVTGLAPFAVEDLVRGAATGHRGEPTPARRVSPCSAEFSAILDVCLREDPASRYADGEELVADLERLQRGEVPQGHLGPDGAGGGSATDEGTGGSRVAVQPTRVSGPAALRARRLLVGTLGTTLVVLLLLVLAGPSRGPRPLPAAGPVPGPEAESLLREILQSAYGGARGPDPPSVEAVLRELDGLIRPGMDPTLGGSLVRQWRSAARSLPGGSPARFLVEALLLQREGSHARAATAMAAALRAQRLLLGGRGEALTPSQLSLDPMVLERFLETGRTVVEPRLLRDVLDETDAFLCSLPPALADGPWARRLRVLSLCGRVAGWSRAGTVEPGEVPPAELRSDAGEGLAVWALRLPRDEQVTLPPWCRGILEAARAGADPVPLERLGLGADCDLAREAERSIDGTIKELLRTSREFAFVEGNMADHVRSVVAGATRTLRRASWRASALAWCPGAPPAAAASFARAAVRLAYVHYLAGVAEIQVAGRLGDGLSSDLLIGGGVAVLIQVLHRVPGVAGEDLAAPGAMDLLRRSSSLGRSGREGRERVVACAASRPLLRVILQLRLRGDEDDTSAETELLALLVEQAWSLLEPSPTTAAERWPGARALAEGLREGWPRLVELGRAREVETAALRVARALEAVARPEPADEGARILRRLALVSALNARLLIAAGKSPGTTAGADEDGGWLRGRVSALAAIDDPEDPWDLIKLARAVEGGDVVWK